MNLAAQSGVAELFTIAESECPAELADVQRVAWIGQRIIQLIEEGRTRGRANQVMLAVQLHQSGVWMEHPKEYERFRDFLADTGMSSSGISDACTMAERIIPQCEKAGLEVQSLINPSLWGRLRQAIPALRHNLENEDFEAVKEILDDVPAMPSSSIAEKYRSHRQEKYAEAEILKTPSGRIAIVVVLDEADVTAAKTAIGKIAEWGVVVADSKANGTLTMKIS